MSRQTVEAFVLSRAKNATHLFAYSNVISRDLIINGKFLPPGLDLLGKWIRVAVRDHNSVCQQVMLIDNVFESRMMNGIPEIRVRVIHDGRFENMYEMFYHDYFGYVCDTLNIVPHVKRDGIYTLWISRLHEPRINSRWRVSSNQTTVGFNEEKTNSKSSRKVEAIIHSYSLDGKSLYAWSKSEPRSKIIIDLSICDTTKALLGIWVELEVDSNNIAQSAPVLVPDVYETRVRYGITEIRVDFDAETTPGLFYNNYFGNINDPLKMVPKVEQNVWYDGWIMFYIKHGVDARWRLSKDQVIQGPYNIPHSRPAEDVQTNDRFYINSHSRDSSPDVRNEYRRSRSSSPQDICDGSRTFIENTQRENYHQKRDSQEVSTNIRKQYDFIQEKIYETKSHSFDNNTFEYDNRFHEHLENNKNQQNENSPNSNEREHFSSLMNNETYSPNSHDRQTDQEAEQLNRRRSRSPRRSISKNNRIRTPDSEYYTCSEDELDMNDRNEYGPKVESPSKSKDVSIEMKPVDSNLSAKSDKKVSQNSASVGSNVKVSTKKPERTPEDIEIIRLKSKLVQISRLVLSLTEDEYITQQMKVLGLEEYEELMKLVNL